MNKFTNASIKLVWGATLSALAAPTALDLVSRTPGIIAPVAIGGILLVLVASPFALACLMVAKPTS